MLLVRRGRHQAAGGCPTSRSSASDSRLEPTKSRLRACVRRKGRGEHHVSVFWARDPRGAEARARPRLPSPQRV